MSRHALPGRRGRIVGVLLAALIGSAAVLGGAVVVTDPGAPVPAATTTPTPDPMRVRYAFVVAVPDAASAVLDSGDGPEPVRISGIAPPVADQCGAADALEHARDRLLGVRVTVVPDPVTPAGPVHLVLPTQQSYSDAALTDGYATVAPGPWTYRDGGEAEARVAARAGRGLWADGRCWEGLR